MKTIVILTRRSDTAADQFARLHREELLAVWGGIESGVLRAIHGLQDGGGAVLEMEASAIDEVKKYIDALPYVAEKLLDVRYCALKPFAALKDLFATP